MTRSKAVFRIYAGTGCITTKETVEMSKRAEALGADILSVTHHTLQLFPRTSYMSTTRQLLRQLRSRLFFTNIPARTGCSIAPETVAKLAEIDNIVGAKDSSGNWDNLKAYIRAYKR